MMSIILKPTKHIKSHNSIFNTKKRIMINVLENNSIVFLYDSFSKMQKNQI